MSSLMQRVLKAGGNKLASTLESSEMFNQRDVISTTLPVLNIAMSGRLDGGIHAGLTLLAGPSRHFKTNLAIVMIKAYLDKYEDAICVFFDSEGGATPEYFSSQGVDPARVAHIPIDHLEQLKFEMVKTLKELNRGDHVVIVVDSIGNTASLKELSDAEDGKSKVDMTRAKEMKALFRMVTPSFNSKNIPCIAIAHTYQTMEIYSKAVISGGTGPLYSASTAIILGRQQVKGDDGLEGFNFVINVEKSRYVKEKSKLSFKASFETGIDKWSSLFDLAAEAGFVEKVSMGWWARVDPDTGEVEEGKFREKAILQDDDFFERLVINEKFKLFVQNKYSLA